MKHKIYLIIVISLLFFSCSNSIMLNQRIKEDKYLNRRGLILTPLGSLEKHVELTDSLNLGLNRDNVIIYISTNKHSFTVVNLKVGSKLSDIPNYKKEDIIYNRGFAYSIKVNDIWYAAFDFKNLPSEESKILFFFQYEFDLPLKKTKPIIINIQ